MSTIRRVAGLAAFLLVGDAVIGARAGAADAADATAASPPGEITFVASNAVSTANGTFHSWRLAELALVPGDLASSHATVVVDVASIDTGIEQRDEHLRTADFFEVERWPTATARIHSLRANGATAEGHARHAATFELTIRDVTKSVEGEVVIERREPLAVSGSLAIDRTQWGIGTPKTWYNPLSITNEVTIAFRAEVELGDAGQASDGAQAGR